MNRIFALLVLLCFAITLSAQTNRVYAYFPEGTVLHPDLNYAGDTLSKHLLDLYLPPDTDGPLPLVVWIHGGAWMVNDKYADMSYMQQTVHDIVGGGYALASIDYRHSTQAVFPAQLQDCNQAIEFLNYHAADYGLDTSRIAVMGFSAGGHLASLVGLAHNKAGEEFYAPGTDHGFRIRGVVDFYGPANLVMFPGAGDPESPESKLLGAPALDRPDLAAAASPVTYVDAADPPFLIVQGELDESVNPAQSRLLSSWLSLGGVENELIIVPGAPHYGPEFDVPEVRERVLSFLNRVLE
ncbi:alpha/beta hydrolase [Lewinella sp. IMCC34191]|uniref:alpha/beta hydrolase n=1 Tax=Lewinella sp. IMCC34191 TaxID=2259172 RepID=UPI000E22D4DD|nr:alpha/beta hydrolase [Lewinella sp. IMCC34191]